jgi:hypothetical protein
MKAIKKILIVAAGFMLSGSIAMAQTNEQTEVDSSKNLFFQSLFDNGNFPKKQSALLNQFNVSGYYRFVTNYRHLDIAYPHLRKNPNNIFVGDDSQIPQLMLNLSGSVSKNTSFGTDLYMWSPMTGAGERENVKGLNLGISLYGTYSSDYGDFTVKTGGINWYALTPFTFQANKGYDRYSIFERNPWDPNTKNIDSRYATFYNAGAINQDERWGQQAFQGLIIEGNKLPNGFSGVLMYGKTQLNGGLSPLPNSSYGGKIKKEYKSNFISFNTFNNCSFTDSTQKSTVGFNVATIEFKNTIGKLIVRGEVGGGRNFAGDNISDWGEAVSVKFEYPIRDKFPTEFHLYRISPRVLNNSAAFINSAIDQNYLATSSVGVQPVLPAVASSMVAIGQLVNNRQGFDVNAQINFGRLKTSFGYSNSSEVENLSSKLTYSHPINSLVLAHFWRWDFPSNVGPYNNLSKIYRTVYETVNITNVNAVTKLPIERKYFNSIEMNMKWKGTIFNRDYYLYYLGQYSSAQPTSSPITVFSEQAYLRTYYHQIESYIKINKSLVWCNYAGFERIIANYDTETDLITKRPKNQTGYSIATGFDIRMSKGAGLYLRQRWMEYADASFKDDQYKGFETTVEIKIFF